MRNLNYDLKYFWKSSMALTFPEMKFLRDIITTFRRVVITGPERGSYHSPPRASRAANNTNINDININVGILININIVCSQ